MSPIPVRTRPFRAALVPFLFSFGVAAEDFTFAPVSLPSGETAKRQIRGSAQVQIGDRSALIDFHPILRSGQALGAYRFGRLTRADGAPLADGQGGHRISDRPDFSSLHRVDGKLFLLTQFETTPGALYLSELVQSDKGALSAVATRPLDLAPVGGGWRHCAGSRTPWGTHLGSEEYEPDARFPPKAPGDPTLDDDWQPMLDYFAGDPQPLNPYRYGWPLEVTLLDSAGNTEIGKRYALGRRSLELGLVMPDRRSVYLTDDGTNGVFSLFVADRPGDLSAGRLYAARWAQHSKTGKITGSELSWIDLGHARSEQIERFLDQGMRFQDLFASTEPSLSGCPQGYTSINTGHHGPYHECLRLKPGRDLAASRLESRRYAALRGATSEWRKMEGLAFDPITRRLYLAISAIEYGMEDRRKRGELAPGFDLGGPNDMRLDYNPCGAVFELQLGAGVSDQSGHSIGSEYVALAAAVTLQGRVAETAMDADNQCDLHAIANPDNLTLLPDQRLLIIAEDSNRGHANNALWAYHLDRERLTRILTAPLGAEVTGVDHYPDMGGYGYLLVTIQHPLQGLSDASGSSARRASVGYLGPWPAVRTDPTDTAGLEENR